MLLFFARANFAFFTAKFVITLEDFLDENLLQIDDWNQV